MGVNVKIAPPLIPAAVGAAPRQPGLLRRVHAAEARPASRRAWSSSAAGSPARAARSRCAVSTWARGTARRSGRSLRHLSHEQQRDRGIARSQLHHGAAAGPRSAPACTSCAAESLPSTRSVAGRARRRRRARLRPPGAGAGIRFLWDKPQGYDLAATRSMPHAWQAGAQTKLLAAQLRPCGRAACSPSACRRDPCAALRVRSSARAWLPGI